MQNDPTAARSKTGTSDDNDDDPLAAVLETPRLRLRPLGIRDVDFVFQHFSDPAVHRWLLDNDPVREREAAREIVEFYRREQEREPGERTCNRWGIELRKDESSSELIGTCGFHKRDRRNRRAEIGYDLGEAFWNQGFMTEAVRRMIEHGFEALELNRISAIVHPENRASIRLLDKLGFTAEGCLRDLYCADGRFHDHLILALLKSDWRRP